MKLQLELTPLQVKYLKKLVDQDSPAIEMDRYIRGKVSHKLQDAINESALQIGKDVDSSLLSIKAKEK